MRCIWLKQRQRYRERKQPAQVAPLYAYGHEALILLVLQEGNTIT